MRRLTLSAERCRQRRPRERSGERRACAARRAFGGAYRRSITAFASGCPSGVLSQMFVCTAPGSTGTGNGRRDIGTGGIMSTCPGDAATDHGLLRWKQGTAGVPGARVTRRACDCPDPARRRPPVVLIAEQNLRLTGPAGQQQACLRRQRSAERGVRGSLSVLYSGTRLCQLCVGV